MTDELYRRCPDCLDSDPGAPCPTCGGERYVPVPPEQPRHRRAIRINTLMALIAFAAVASYIVTGWRREAQQASLVGRALAAERQVAAKARAQAVTAPAPANPRR